MLPLIELGSSRAFGDSASLCKSLYHREKWEISLPSKFDVDFLIYNLSCMGKIVYI